MAAKWGALLVSIILVCVTMTAGAEVWYVDKANTSGIEDGLAWATAFVTIQEGIDAASSGEQVWVKQGVYDELRSSFPHIPGLPDVDTGSVLMKDGVDLYGGFVGTEASPDERAEGTRSIIDGSTSRAGLNAYSVLVAASATLDGFEITGGRNKYDRLFAPAFQSNGRSPTIKDCVIQNNTSTTGTSSFHSGGALRLIGCQFLQNTAQSNTLYCLNSPSVYLDGCLFQSSGSTSLAAAIASNCADVTVSDCTFENTHTGLELFRCGNTSVIDSEWIQGMQAVSCTFGAIDISGCAFLVNKDPHALRCAVGLSYCTADIEACQFTGDGRGVSSLGSDVTLRSSSLLNSAASPVLSADRGTISIEDCLFSDNSGGISFYMVSDVHVARTSFLDSQHLQGGNVGLHECSAVFDACLFAGNAVQAGGAVSIRTSDVTIQNSTIAGNTASLRGGAIVAETGCRLRLVNSIVWANGQTPIVQGGVSDVTATYCDIEGGYPGTGNLATDPIFVDPAAGDYRLAWDSPCLDAGDPETPAGFDLLGVPSPQMEGPDMGAYERVLNDGDGDGMDDGWEADNGLDPDNDADGVLDLDGDGVSNRDEFYLRTGVNDPDDPAGVLYVAVTGNDTTGDGSETAPWATIERAMDLAAAYSAFLPVTVFVGAGDYNEPVFFAQNVTVEGAGPSATTIHYLNLADNEHVTVTGAQGALLKNCKVAQPGYLSVPTVLLRIDGVAMEVENVVFDGNDNLYSLGAMISDIGSSDSEIRDCVFRRLYNGIQAVNSGVNIVRNQFESIREDAVFVRLPDARKAYDPIVTPLLGDASRALTTGNNQFRSVFGSFVFSMSPDMTKAENNDWGLYDRKQIAAKMNGAVDFEPFYGSEDQPVGCRGGSGRVDAGDGAVLLLTAFALALALRRRARD